MARTMTLAAGQYQCAVGNKDANLATIERLTLQAAEQGAEFICFPEMGVTGLGGGRHLAETIPGPAVEQLGALAAQHRLYLLAGLMERDDRTGSLHNAAVLLDPTGNLAAHYRKRCLYLGEKDAYTPGTQNVLHDIGPCKAGLTICYDYVFADYIRQLCDAGAELVCHPTAWLTTDVCEQWHYSPMAFRAMGMTRALENTVYFLSANLWGNADAAGHLRAIGQSAIIAPWGEILAEVPEGEGLAVATVDFDATEGWRQAAAPYPEDRVRYGF